MYGVNFLTKKACVFLLQQCSSINEQNKKSTSTINKILVSLLNSTSSQQTTGRDQQMEWEEQWNNWLKKTSLQKEYSIQVQRPHELFKYCSSVTFFNVQEEQILNYQNKCAHLFNTAAVKVYHCSKPLNSRATITAITSLSTTFTAHNNTSQAKQHRLIPQWLWSLHMLPVSIMDIGAYLFHQKNETTDLHKIHGNWRIKF
jgi:hypothetical protein